MLNIVFVFAGQSFNNLHKNDGKNYIFGISYDHDKNPHKNERLWSSDNDLGEYYYNGGKLLENDNKLYGYGSTGSKNNKEAESYQKNHEDYPMKTYDSLNGNENSGRNFPSRNVNRYDSERRFERQPENNVCDCEKNKEKSFSRSSENYNNNNYNKFGNNINNNEYLKEKPIEEVTEKKTAFEIYLDLLKNHRIY